MNSAIQRALYWSCLNPTTYIVLTTDTKPFRAGQWMVFYVTTFELARELIQRQFAWMRENQPTRQRSASIILAGNEIEQFNDDAPAFVPTFVVQESAAGYRYQLTDAGRAAAAAIRAELDAAEGVEVGTFQPRSVD